MYCKLLSEGGISRFTTSFSPHHSLARLPANVHFSPVGRPAGHGPSLFNRGDGCVRHTRKFGRSVQSPSLTTVHQLEYDGVEGMILLSELSRRRIRSVQKLIREGRNEVVVVMRVDPDKGEWVSSKIWELSTWVMLDEVSCSSSISRSCRNAECPQRRL